MLPSFCIVDTPHFGLTWEDNKLCSIHRQLTSESIPAPKFDAMQGAMLWVDLQNVTGLPPADDMKAVVYSIAAFMTKLYRDAVMAETFRWFSSLNIIELGERNSRAWDMRNGVSARLFPSVMENKETALVASAEKADRFGRSLASNQILLSYTLTTFWKLLHACNISSLLDADSAANVKCYVESMGNISTETSVHVVFGEQLYLFNNVVFEGSGVAAVNKTRFDAGLLAVPAAYVAAETAYQAQLVKTNEEAIRLAAAQKVQSRENAKMAGKIALGLLGAAADDISERGKRKDEKADRARTEKHRQITEQNSRIINERLKEQEQRRHLWTGGNR